MFLMLKSIHAPKHTQDGARGVAITSHDKSVTTSGTMGLGDRRGWSYIFRKETRVLQYRLISINGKPGRSICPLCVTSDTLPKYYSRRYRYRAPLPEL